MTEKELKVHKKQEVQQSGEPTKPERRFVPAVDIFETDGAVTVIAEMPGVPKDGVDIYLEEGTLTITGSRVCEVCDTETVLLKEYETGNYFRQFAVSETIDQDEIEATMTNGILTLVLPKIAPAKPRKIEVKGV